ncbi:MAG: dCTP deaminase domain-containing protein [Longimicrobiaceae bacterium]
MTTISDAGGALPTILSGSEIRRRLSQGEIFNGGTWDERRIRNAGYDLLVAKDLLIVPDANHPRGRKYRRGKECADDEVVLKPGEVAFLSTHERMKMPRDLCGQVSGRFESMQQGLLILGGLIVDPGYGLNRGDARLHFWVANIGQRNLSIKPGESRIASIQFFPVAGAVDEALEQEEEKDWAAEYFDDDDAHFGLGFFKIMAQLHDQTSSAVTDLAARSEAQDKEIVELRQRADALTAEMAVVSQGTSQIVLFGVFLLCTTFLGVILALAFAFLASPEATKVGSNLAIVPWWKLLIICMPFAAVFAVVTAWIQRLFDRRVTRMTKPSFTK